MRGAAPAFCEGCMGRVGSREGTSRPLAANLPRNVRGRSPALITRTWTPSDTLPLTSRAEAQIHRINRSIALQAERTQHQQQIQFELNQLRGELQRAYLFR
jgi:hypothetical protein